MLRKHYGSLLGGQPTNTDLDLTSNLSSTIGGDVHQQVDNPFSNETLSLDISLSVYNGPRDSISRKMRPFTTPDQLLKRVPGYKGAENKP